MTETKDRPWLFRTYAGHSTASASNALYDQSGQGADRASRSPSICPRRPGMTAITCWRGARSARSACPLRISATCGRCSTVSRWTDEHLDDDQRHRRLAAGALHRGGRGAGRDHRKLQGTVQNDIIKEYLSRGTYVCPPEPSLRMITDVAAYTYAACAEVEPDERLLLPSARGGATPEQELAFALATATAVLDELQAQESRPGGLSRHRRPHLVFRERRHPLRHRDVQDARLRRPVGRDHRDRYGVTDPKLRRFRYGVQVNSSA